jgi:hypothetical protein
LQTMMTVFSSPAYATMLSDRDVLFLGQKAKAFVVYLPVPFCLILHPLPVQASLLTYLIPFSRVSVGQLHFSSERRERGSKCPSSMMIHAIHSQSPL